MRHLSIASVKKGETIRDAGAAEEDLAVLRAAAEATFIAHEILYENAQLINLRFKRAKALVNAEGRDRSFEMFASTQASLSN